MKTTRFSFISLLIVLTLASCLSSEEKEVKAKRFYSSAIIAAKEGNCSNAVSLLRDANRLSPQNMDIDLALNIADDCFMKKIYEDVLNNLFNSMVAFDNGDLGYSIVLAEEACNRGPYYSSAYNYLGHLYLKSKEKANLDNAMKSFIKAIEVDSTNGMAHYNIALVYLSQSDWPSAKAYIIKASELNYQVPNHIIDKVPEDVFSSSEKAALTTIASSATNAKNLNNSRNADDDSFISSLWPFGPKGFICRHIAPSAYTSSGKMFLYRIGGCLDYKKK